MAKNKSLVSEKNQLKALQVLIVFYNIPFFLYLIFFKSIHAVAAIGNLLDQYTRFILNHFGLFMVLEFLVVAVLVADVILTYEKRGKKWRSWTVGIAFMAVVLFSTKIVAKMFDMLYTNIDQYTF